MSKWRLPSSVLPDISPSRGEINRGTGSISQLALPTTEMKREACHLLISPLEGEMSGRAEGGIVANI
ncbi:hypothetical protein DXT91_21095 [Agrobacterium tumefaciens]|nr:hypothetical protein [Agrobacterium tumefaciens]